LFGASHEPAGFLVKSEGMHAANPNCAVRCSMDTPAVFDEEQIKCELAAQVLKDSGMLRLRASGSSMMPSLWPGDILAVQPQSFERWRPGDIALYMRAGHFFIHRVITVADSGDFLIVQGDCLPQPDPPVVAKEVLGKVVAIERDGLPVRAACRPSISLRIFSRALWNCSFLLHVVMAIRAHRSSLRSVRSKRAWSFMQ
jgi:Peptidase S24-like